MRNAWMSAVLMVAAVSAGCSGGGGGKSKGKPGPSDPKGVASKPAGAMPAGMTTSLGGTGSVPLISTSQAGDSGDPEYCWSENIDGDAEGEACCVVEDDETGASVALCEGYTDECDDGTEEDATLIIAEAADGSGTFAVAGDDICGSGVDLMGCDYDSGGEVESCGACAMQGGSLVCADDDDGDDDDGDDDGIGDDDDDDDKDDDKDCDEDKDEDCDGE